MRVVCRAYAKIAYYMHVHAKTRAYHIYAEVNFCVSTPRAFVFIRRTIYTHFHESGLTVSVLNGLNGGAEERIVPCLGITELYLAHAVLKSHLLK